MRKVLGITLVAIGVAAGAAFGADNTIGTWKLNTAKSKYTPAPMPLKSLTTAREASDSGVKATNSGELADGTAINTSYTAKYDGTPATVTGTGAPYDTIMVKQVNANTITEERKKSDGKYHATARAVVSHDGKTMTTTAKGTNSEGKPFTSTFVFDKQ